MTLTIAEIHRINLALGAVSRGFPNGDGKNVHVIRTTVGKLRIARNLKRLRDALEPAETAIAKERERLAELEKLENPNATELTGPRAAELSKIAREVNGDKVDIHLDDLTVDDLDLEHFNGEEAMQALAVLSDSVLADETPEN